MKKNYITLIIVTSLLTGCLNPNKNTKRPGASSTATSGNAALSNSPITIKAITYATDSIQIIGDNLERVKTATLVGDNGKKLI